MPAQNIFASFQPTDLQASGENGSITVSSSSVPATIKMEDLALVVSNPQSSQGSSGEGEGVLVDTAAVETITIGALSQDDAAEAIQGLQALAQRGVLESGTVVEEQVQVSAGRPGELKEQVQVSVGRPDELKEQVQMGTAWLTEGTSV